MTSADHAERGRECPLYNVRSVSLVGWVDTDYGMAMPPHAFKEHPFTTADFQNTLPSGMASDDFLHAIQMLLKHARETLLILVALVVDHEIRFEGGVVHDTCQRILDKVQRAGGTISRFCLARVDSVLLHRKTIHRIDSAIGHGLLSRE